ncbi:MAG: energy-coupling factor ABC transporter permease [Desulfurococcales archaeon]|nr:energy-coupling factor ABC transporter permease [Desulfurococcales archaeon]
MHIPDGFLDAYWVAITYAATLGYYAYLSASGRLRLDTMRVSLITTLAAAIFAAQMLNWPIPGGTSLHLLGGALAGILLGPAYGSLTLALVLIVQALVFHDGGLTTLGANILNMGIIAVLTGYYTFKYTMKLMGTPSSKSLFITGLLAGWASVFLAGVACGVEIGLSPRFPYGVEITLPVMGGWHFALGIVEGVITGLVLSYIYKRDPSIIEALRTLGV